MSNLKIWVLLLSLCQAESFKISFGIPTEMSEGPGMSGQPVLIDTRGPIRGRNIEDHYGVPPEDIVYVARNVDQPSVINRLFR